MLLSALATETVSRVDSHAETHSQSKGQEQVTVECSALNEALASIPQGPGNILGEVAERM